MYGCNGQFVPEDVAAVFDEMAHVSRSHRYLDDLETRKRLHYAEQRENLVIEALLTVAERSGAEERAAFFPATHRSDKSDEATRIAADHGFGPDRLVAMKSLAHHRGVELETVLRAALRGDLRSIVMLPDQRTREG